MSELLMLGVVVIGGYFAWKEGIFDKVFSELKGAVGNLPALPALPTLGGGGGGGGISSSGTCVGTALKPDHQGSSKRWESEIFRQPSHMKLLGVVNFLVMI